MCEAAETFADNCLEAEYGTVTSIARIQLVRSVKSIVLAASTVTLEAVFASEFYDSIPELVDINSLYAAFIPVQSGQSPPLPTILKSTSAFACKSSKSKKCGGKFNLTFPTGTGRYQLFLFSGQEASLLSDPNKHTGGIILPLLTSHFDVVSAEEMAVSNVMPLLSCHRIIDSIVIEEEYGKMLGSHIYDSSVVILRFLASHYDSPTNNIEVENIENKRKLSVAVEIGAGCGLVSIWLSKFEYIHRVLATDLELQLPLIERNIQSNNVSHRCSTKALNWSDFSKNKSKVSPTEFSTERLDQNTDTSNSELDDVSTNLQPCKSVFESVNNSRQQLWQQYLELTGDETISLIVAGDVLYSPTLAEDFFSVVRSLAVPDLTIIFVAQKLRNLNSAVTVDMKNVPGFLCEIVWQEASVIIWRLHLTVSCI